MRKWVVANKLTLNIKKTHYIIFHRKKIVIQIPPVKIGNTVLERVDSTQFLGLTIQDSLKWDKHIQRVCEKISKLCGILYLTRHQLTTRALKQIYYSLIYPNITYCITVWGSAGKTKVTQIVTAQKRVIRTIRGLNRMEHTNNSFSDMKILKFTDIIDYCSAVYVYKSIHEIKENKYFVTRENAAYNLKE